MRIALAGPEHDAQLRSLLREHPMPGWVELALEREPDFFAAARTQGDPSQTIVALEGDAVVGMGCRAIREVYLNGCPTSLGYLSGLRLRASHRHGTVLARGYRFLRHLHEDGRAAAYVSTIIEANRPVRELLESGRSGLPRYRDLGRYFTFAIALGRWTPARRPRGSIAVAPAAPAEMDSIVEFLNEHGRRRQFFPVLKRGDLGSPAWLGLEARHLMTARGADGGIEGVAACWDQSAYKQSRVVRYGRSLAIVRPPLDAVLRLAGLQGLPGEGRLLSGRSLSLLCVRGDDTRTFAALLNGIHAEYRGVCDWLMVGLHERDPLRRAIRSWTSLRYVSRLYGVAWEDGLSVIHGLESARIPYLDVATL